MTYSRRVALSLLALPLAAFAATPHAAPAAQTPASSLTAVLNQLDAASAKFKSVQANVHYDNYTRAVKDHDLHTGTIYVERSGGVDRMGALDFGASGKTPVVILNYDGNVLHNYTAGTNQDDIFKAGDNKAKYQSFLTLGFGGSGKSLSQSWTITDGGSEMISDGSGQVKTEKLDLIPKDPSVANVFKQVTIWIDPVRGISLKQIFYAPNGDTRTAEYTDIKLNGSVDKKPYTIPKKATPNVH
ncbi:MAG TPA: outer membrane lipoprotein-sorting protein [Acidobacteriaceae bacterium]